MEDKKVIFNRDSIMNEEFNQLDKMDKLAEVCVFYMRNPEKLKEDLYKSLELITLEDIDEQINNLLVETRPDEYQTVFRYYIEDRLSTGFDFTYLEAYRRIGIGNGKMLEYFNGVNNKSIELTDEYAIRNRTKSRLKKDSIAKYDIMPEAYYNMTNDCRGPQLENIVSERCYRYSGEGKTTAYTQDLLIQTLYSIVAENRCQKDEKGFYTVYLGDFLRNRYGEKYTNEQRDKLKAQLVEASKNMYIQEEDGQEVEKFLFKLDSFALTTGAVKFSSEFFDYVYACMEEQGARTKAEKLGIQERKKGHSKKKAENIKKLSSMDSEMFSHSSRISLKMHSSSLTSYLIFITDYLIAKRGIGYQSNIKAETLVERCEGFEEKLKTSENPRKVFQNAFIKYIEYLYKYYILPEGQEIEVKVKLNGKMLEPSDYKSIKHAETGELLSVPVYPLPTAKNSSKYIFLIRVKQKNQKAKKQDKTND